MKELYELKEHLVDALKDYGKRDLSSGSLDMIDKLAHAAKNVCKIIDSDEDGYSGNWSYDRGYRYSNKRDGMGRYSRHGLSDKLRDLMDEAPDEQTRMEIKRLIEKV